MISPQVTKHQMAFIFPLLNGKNVILLALESQAGQWEDRTDSLSLLYTHLAKKVRESKCGGVMPGKGGRVGTQQTESLAPSAPLSQLYQPGFVSFLGRS